MFFNKIFYKTVAFVLKHSLLVIICTILFTAVMLTSVVQLKVNPDYNTLIPKDEQSYIDFQNLYNKGDFTDNLIVMLTGNDLYTPEHLSLIQQAIIKIESYENLSEGIHPFSFVTASKKGSRLSVSPMTTVKPGEEWTQQAADEMKQRILADEIAENLFVSSDGDSILLYFPAYVIPEINSRQILELEEIVSPLREFAEVSLNGGLFITEGVLYYLQKDLTLLLVICFLVILIIYYLSFRTKRSVFLPMSVVVFGTIWSLGIISLFGFELTIINIITPVLVLTLGSSYSIHLLNEYYRTHPKNMNYESKDWILDVIRNISPTIIIAGLTTVAGFLSLLVTKISEFREFGISTSIGILSCVLLTLFYLPAVLSRLPNPNPKIYHKVVKGRFSSFINKLAIFVINKWAYLLVLFVLTIAIFSYAYPKVYFETSYVHYFPQENIIVTGFKKIVSKIGGMDGVYITIDAPSDNDKYFLNPDVLKKIDTFEQTISKNVPEVTHILSFPAYVRFFNNVMTGESEIPKTPGLIMLMSRYLGIISESSVGNSDLEMLLDDSGTRMTIAFRYANENPDRLLDLKDTLKVIDALEYYAEELLPPDCNYTIWGQMRKLIALSSLIEKDQRNSTLLSLFIVFLIAWGTFKSFKYGILSLIPILFGIMTNTIVMYLLNIPFDMITIAFASVTVGVGIDDAIHFIIRFKTLYFNRSGSLKPAVKRTIILTGRPIILTTISIIGGLSVLTLASFIPIRYFGLLISLALFNTLLATLFILPSGLIFWIGTQRAIKKWKEKKKLRHKLTDTE